MPMPHRTYMQRVKRRLVGTEGAERIRVLRTFLDDLPGYKNGPYGEIRQWLQNEIEGTRLRARVVHRDSIAVRREGAAQIALVGPPNAGKSSLLHALSHLQIKMGDYAFTTLRPVPALTRIGGVLVQLVEIPGLLAGAAEGRGGGRALLGVLREADAIVFCHDVTAPLAPLRDVRAEVAAAGIALPAIIAVTKLDEAAGGALNGVQAAVPDLPVVGVSVLDDESLDGFRGAVWRLTGLVRVYLRRGAEVDAEPLALPAGATVTDVAAAIHKELAAGFRGARVWGPSARFDGQQVAREHTVRDRDTVEILT